MNNRLEDLLYQSGLTAQGCWDELDVYAKTAVEKFAKLIVEECRDVLADAYRKTPLECCGHFLRADEVLAEHFYGVKQQ